MRSADHRLAHDDPVFVNQVVRMGERSAQITAQRTTCPWLVVAPALATSDLGALSLTGGLTLVHRPTGLVVAAGGRDMLHELAERLSRFDWKFCDPTHFIQLEHRHAALDIVAIIRQCQLSEPACNDTGEPRQRGRSASDQLLTDVLHWWISHSRRAPQAISGDPQTWAEHVDAQIRGYGFAYLLAVLCTVDPAVADAAAADLQTVLAGGDDLADPIHRWLAEHASGTPLTLPGIPRADSFAAFAPPAAPATPEEARLPCGRGGAMMLSFKHAGADS